MGATYEYRCADCYLYANVSGGDDCGMWSEWTTVWCRDCETLSDAGTSSQDTSGNWQKYDLECRVCKSKNVRKWSDKEPCPLCGGKMRRSAEIDEFLD